MFPSYLFVELDITGNPISFNCFLNAKCWCFLVTTSYFLYGESIIYYFQQIVSVDRALLPFATHHRFISFVLYVIVFVFFVGNLKKSQCKQRIRQLGWMHMALLLVVF
ncbi:hypothetical protein BD408DRAFT_424877 [Parasitella parasitica]|nr:hypothetical protein BD408DRAFT_424877 [Parasitella parasitica]